MKLSEDKRNRLHELIAALRDQRLSAEAQQELETMVISCPAARRLFVSIMFLNASLMWTHCQGQANVDLSTPADADTSRSSSGRLHFTHEGHHSFFSSTLTISVLLVGFLFYGSFIAIAWNLRPNSATMLSSKDVPDSVVRTSRGKVATLTRASRCRWQRPDNGLDKKMNIGDLLDSGELLQLDSGIAEITFSDGARVSLAGPCSFELLASGKGYLRNGALVARVPPQAIGFEVETPTARVVDLGTDFRLEANSKETTLAVIAGKVDLFPANMKQGRSLSRRVKAGQAFTITAAANGSQVVRRTKFDKKWLTTVSRIEQQAPRPSTVVAYQVSENTAGNQRSFQGGVGLDFQVSTPIRVFSLGVFDHLGDGIDPETNPIVQLWSRDTRNAVGKPCDDTGIEVLAFLEFSAREPGDLKAGHRFKFLHQPIDLPVGAYSIVVSGLRGKNPFFALDEPVPDVDFQMNPNWTGSNNSIGGNSYGWNLVSNEAGGNREAGGTFARAQIDSFYGDTQLRHTFDLNDKITASGKFRVGNITQGWSEIHGEGGFFIGHFSSDAASPEFIGLQLKESGHRSLMHVRARFQLSPGNGAESKVAVVSTRDSHTFSYVYDPSTNQLALTIDSQPIRSAILNPMERNSGAKFNAFGIGATSNLSSENEPTKTAQVFVDDVTYCGCRTAKSRSVNTVASLRSTAQVRVETLHGAIVPTGSRFGEREDGSFPTMRSVETVSHAAGSFEYLPQQQTGSKQ